MRRPSFAAVVGFAVTLSGAAAAQGRPSHPGASQLAVYSRLLAMTDTRQLDTALIGQALADKWGPLRAAATLAIGQIGRDRGLPGATRLRALLGDSDSAVAANAAYALGLLRDSAAVPVLSSALGLRGAVAREAAWALGEIGAPSRTTIIAELGRPHRSDVSVQLLLAAAKLRPIPLPVVRKYLVSGEGVERWAAAYAIARTRASGGVRDLLSLYESAPAGTATTVAAAPSSASGPYTDSRLAAARLRAEIARGLASAAAGDSLGDKAFAALSSLARDPDPHVRINALRSLGTYRARGNAILLRGARDSDPNVRIAAAQSLSAAFTPAGSEFSALWSADTSIVYRSSLLASAAKAGLRPPQLREWASSSDWRLRAAVANAAGDTSDRTFAISRVRPLLADHDPRVRENAYGALTPPASMPLEDSVHRLLVAGLSDPDFYVRATVIGAMAERPSAVDLAAILGSYRAAQSDSANDARLAVLQYVTALWKRDSASVTSDQRSQLAALPIPADPLERNAGAAIPVWSRWASVKPTPKPAAWYDTLVRQLVLPGVEGKRVTATIHTVRGPIQLELFAVEAPATVWNFLSLARSGYYRNTHFHRVVPNFVAQDGDPRDDGNGGPGYAIRDEMNRNRYERGALGMALSGPDTGGSQYFITHSPQPHLDGHYTVFGHVLRGYDVLDRIVQGDAIMSVDPR